MKYMGSKARFANEILPIILAGRTEGQYYIEPFAGGMNMICNVSGNRIANDVNEYLISMWIGLTEHGWLPPEHITKEQYNEIRAKQNEIDPRLVGWVGFNCSYSGKFFGGYAGKTKTKIGAVRDYQQEAINNIKKQIAGVSGVLYFNKNYYDIDYPENSIIYCDPPYKGTTKYNTDFDHELFFDWAKDMTCSGHAVFISEYDAPEGFECVWEKTAKSSLSANGKVGGSKLSTERLFKYAGFR